MPCTSDGLAMTLEFFEDEAAGEVTVVVEPSCMRAETPAPAPAPANTAAATIAAIQLRGRAGAAGNDGGFGGDPPSSWSESPGWIWGSPDWGSRTRSSAVSPCTALSSCTAVSSSTAVPSLLVTNC